MHRTASAAIVSILAAAGAAAQGDLVSIQGGFYDCGIEVAPGEVEYYRFTGQSAYFSLRTSSLTTGGQLDGTDCRDDDFAQFEFAFFEIFPEAALSDYQTFGYIGIVETVTAFDTDGDGFSDFEDVTDRSFVMSIRDQVGVGTRVEDYFPNLDEATLVTALTTSFDSPEFFDALFQATKHPDLSGDIYLWQSNAGSATNVREGQQMTLIAFTGGANGDEGYDLGYLTTAITNFPSRLCADQNNDGLVTPADFSAWIGNFNANNPTADVNGDLAVTPADFSAWIAEFNLGGFGHRCLN